MGVAMHVFLIAGVLCSGLAAGPVQEPPAPTGPAAYYRLDETSGTSAADSAGGNTGTYVSTPTPSTTVNAPPISYPDPRSLGFNGTNQAVTVANFGAFTSFTVAVWVNRSGTSAARQSIVSYKENASNGFVLCLNDNGSSEFARIWVNVTPGGWLFKENASAVPMGAWTHLAGSYDGSNIRLYVDGTEVVPATAAAGVMTNTGTDTMAIGGRNSVNQHWFPGLVDDVRIYNRALTATEVAVLAAGTPAPSALMATPAIGQIDLAWAAPSGPAATYTYNVQRRLTGSPTYATIANVATLTYSDTSVSGATSYDYQITAVSAAESGPSSSVTSAGLLPPPRTSKVGNEEDRCGCGSATSPGLLGLAAGLTALLGLLLASRR